VPKELPVASLTIDELMDLMDGHVIVKRGVAIALAGPVTPRSIQEKHAERMSKEMSDEVEYLYELGEMNGQSKESIWKPSAGGLRRADR
jgi:hypothetical protein